MIYEFMDRSTERLGIEAQPDAPWYCCTVDDVCSGVGMLLASARAQGDMWVNQACSVDKVSFKTPRLVDVPPPGGAWSRALESPARRAHDEQPSKGHRNSRTGFSRQVSLFTF